jgi:hypothetical protein
VLKVFFTCRLEPDAVQISAMVASLLAAQEELYAAGARNFMFIDLPPIHRSPAGMHAFYSRMC